MARFIIALFLAFPCAADPATQHVGLGCPHFQGEGASSYFEVTDLPDGFRLHIALDIVGPPWMYFEIDSTPSVVRIHAHDSRAGEYDQTRVYASWSAALADTSEFGMLTTAALRRCSLTVLTPPDPLPPPTAATLSLADVYLHLLDSPYWQTREYASQRLREPAMALAAQWLARHRRLSCEARARLVRE